MAVNQSLGAPPAQGVNRAGKPVKPVQSVNRTGSGSFEQSHPRGRGGLWIAKKGDGYGAQGPDQTTAQLQQRLRQLGFKVPVDGKYGVATEQAVKAFQSQYGLGSSGGVDAATLAVLRDPAGTAGGPTTTYKDAAAAKTAASAAASTSARKTATAAANKKAAAATANAPTRKVQTTVATKTTPAKKTTTASKPAAVHKISDLGTGTLREGDGMKGEPKPVVKKLQQALNDVLGTHLTVDGQFGPLTLAAVKRLQKEYGIPTSGQVGPETKGLLVGIESRATSTTKTATTKAEQMARAERKAEEKALRKLKAKRAAERKAEMVPRPKPATPRATGGGAGMKLTHLAAAATVRDPDLEENRLLFGWGDQPSRAIQDYRSEGEAFSNQGLGGQPDRSIKDYRSEGAPSPGLDDQSDRAIRDYRSELGSQLDVAIEERKAAHGSGFVRALARERVLRRRLEELDWNPSLHPRGRGGKWVDVLGKLEHEHAQQRFAVTGGDRIQTVSADGRKTEWPLAPSDRAKPPKMAPIASGRVGAWWDAYYQALREMPPQTDGTRTPSQRWEAMRQAQTQAFAKPYPWEFGARHKWKAEHPKDDIKAVSAKPSFKPQEGGRVRVENPNRPGQGWGDVLRVEKVHAGTVHTVDRYGNKHAHTTQELVPLGGGDRIQAVSPYGQGLARDRQNYSARFKAELHKMPKQNVDGRMTWTREQRKEAERLASYPPGAAPDRVQAVSAKADRPFAFDRVKPTDWRMALRGRINKVQPGAELEVPGAGRVRGGPKVPYGMTSTNERQFRVNGKWLIGSDLAAQSAITASAASTEPGSAGGATSYPSRIHAMLTPEQRDAFATRPLIGSDVGDRPVFGTVGDYHAVTPEGEIEPTYQVRSLPRETQGPLGTPDRVQAVTYRERRLARAVEGEPHGIN